MPEGLYRDDPLSPQQRHEYEEDVISFCDRELDLLGNIEGENVLYAGGTSPLWIEGLSGKIGSSGFLTVLDLDSDALESARDFFAPDDLPLDPEFVVGDVFDLPFGDSSFDLVYSSGLFHELDVRNNEAADALFGMSRVLRAGGRVATSDFVDDVDVADASQIEDEAIEAAISHLVSGAKSFGISSPERLVSLHREALADVRWRVLPPFDIRHLGKLILAAELPEMPEIPGEEVERLRVRRGELIEEIRHEGYSRPATVFVEGVVPKT